MAPFSLLLQPCHLTCCFHPLTAVLLRAVFLLCVCAPPSAPPPPSHTLQPLGFALEGHPTSAFNGAYRKVSEHKGWPVLCNGAGVFCYRYEPDDQWFLSHEHTPDDNACLSWIKSAEGPLPIGAQTWRCYVDGEWVDRSLSVEAEVQAVGEGEGDFAF